MKITASCLCGGVQCTFSYDATSNDNKTHSKLAHCHCRDCQKFHGVAFSTFVPVPGALEWTGEHLLSSFCASNGSVRQFCRVCGSSMTFQASEPQSPLEVALATVDTPEMAAFFQPDAHVFYDHRVSWLPAFDNLPKYRRGRDEEQVKTNAGLLDNTAACM